MTGRAMPATLTQYLALQDGAVLDSFFDDGWCISAAISRGELERLASRRGFAVETLAGSNPADAAVVLRRGHAELWLRARMSGYARPFFAFTRQYCDFAASSVPGYQVDHLFSKNRVQKKRDSPAGIAEQDENLLPPATLVRMLLVAASVNQSFGTLMESAMAGSGNKDRPVRRFTWLQLAKALSIDANLSGGGLSGPWQLANLGHVVAEFAKRGVPEGLGMGREQIMTELLTMAGTVQHYRRQP